MSSEANVLTVLRVSCARARKTSLRLEVFISKTFTAMAVALLAGTGMAVTTSNPSAKTSFPAASWVVLPGRARHSTSGRTKNMRPRLWVMSSLHSVSLLLFLCLCCCLCVYVSLCLCCCLCRYVCLCAVVEVRLYFIIKCFDIIIIISLPYYHNNLS